uniref:Uncharacterized protein TCIL3000_10_10410 n=1 Tax=Trypanosoma congolense (strain IL3000) TaxID=1068625 RepID=G0UXZ5_TRYCI|nr:unnamed protein product [Trypanosoma congolense IL3000]
MLTTLAHFRSYCKAYNWLVNPINKNINAHICLFMSLRTLYGEGGISLGSGATAIITTFHWRRACLPHFHGTPLACSLCSSYEGATMGWRGAERELVPSKRLSFLRCTVQMCPRSPLHTRIKFRHLFLFFLFFRFLYPSIYLSIYLSLRHSAYIYT